MHSLVVCDDDAAGYPEPVGERCAVAARAGAATIASISSKRQLLIREDILGRLGGGAANRSSIRPIRSNRRTLRPSMSPTVAGKFSAISGKLAQ